MRGSKYAVFDVLLSSPKLVKIYDMALDIEGRKIKAKSKSYPENFEGINCYEVCFDIPEKLAKEYNLVSIFLKTDALEKYSEKFTIDFEEHKDVI